MKFDVKFANLDLKQIPETVRRMEALGLDGVWSWETARDPFLPLALAAYGPIAPCPDPLTPHDNLLKAGVTPVEGLNLSSIAPGYNTLYCLPLKPISDFHPSHLCLPSVS